MNCSRERRKVVSRWRERKGHLEINNQPNKAMAHVVLTFIKSGENMGGCVLQIVYNSKAIGTANSKPVRE